MNLFSCTSRSTTVWPSIESKLKPKEIKYKNKQVQIFFILFPSFLISFFYSLFFFLSFSFSFSCSFPFWAAAPKGPMTYVICTFGLGYGWP